MTMNNLKSLWFDEVDMSCPLPEYPRPQMERSDWLCLNGEYDYAITSDSVGAPAEYDGKIIVPFAIESQLSGVTKPLTAEHRLWYRRFFTVPDNYLSGGNRILLHFGAVDWQCEVFVNAKQAGSHTGGYCPFSFDITDLLCEGENELTVKVYDPTDDGWQQRGKQTLNCRGFWYTATSGIWQSVWLEPVAYCHIESLRITPDVDASTVTVRVKHTCECGGKLLVRICDGERVVYDGETDGKSGIAIPDAKLWSPESPFLYDLTVTLDCNGAKDTVKSYFGMRKFSIGKDSAGIPRLFLNNKPYFQKGLLDQGYWPDGGLTAPTDEAMIFDIEKMKELGFNMLRKHIKVEPLRWYYHCDRIGMIVWQDMISGGAPLNLVLAGALPNINVHVRDNKYKSFNRDKPEWREQFKQELFEMIDSLYNCVSIGCWVPFNEGWGQFDAKEIGLKVKHYDKTRLVDHASGWHDQKGPDFKSVHKYILPVHAPTRTFGRPYVLSEYGGYSMILDGHVWNKQKAFGYIMFKQKSSLTAGYKKLHENQIIPLIAKGLCATVYTQVSDVEFEVNGIYTYDRKELKIDAEVIKQINARLTY